jgi:hypothetical protein
METAKQILFVRVHLLPPDFNAGGMRQQRFLSKNKIAQIFKNV